MKNKYVIGTHVMWFEIEMFEDFINGMINLLEPVKTKDKKIKKTSKKDLTYIVFLSYL